MILDILHGLTHENIGHKASTYRQIEQYPEPERQGSIDPPLGRMQPLRHSPGHSPELKTKLKADDGRAFTMALTMALAGALELFFATFLRTLIDGFQFLLEACINHEVIS